MALSISRSRYGHTFPRVGVQFILKVDSLPILPDRRRGACHLLNHFSNYSLEKGVFPLLNRVYPPSLYNELIESLTY
uniref:Uncharacterized protein n=1 Tax=Picea glauca TaxID=3330 RepID=A0A101LVX8_PICGL|nr:hypothetical protein ABT39_MTgene1855 [Picea glauca]